MTEAWSFSLSFFAQKITGMKTRSKKKCPGNTELTFLASWTMVETSSSCSNTVGRSLGLTPPRPAAVEFHCVTGAGYPASFASVSLFKNANKTGSSMGGG